MSLIVYRESIHGGIIMTSKTIKNIKETLEDKVVSAKEFWLVIAMLISLTFLISFIMIYQPEISQTNPEDSLSALLKFKNELIAVILTAFGAWIGAGAAYFFGRENLREATNSMLKMRNLSPKERLSLIKVSDTRPKKIEKIWKETDNVKGIFTHMKQNVDWWFFIIINESGTIRSILHEEAFWRFDAYEQEKSINNSLVDLSKYTISDVINFVEKIENKRKALCDFYIEIKMYNSLSTVNDLMEEKEVGLAIITDENNKPTHFFKSKNIRECLLKEEYLGQ